MADGQDAEDKTEEPSERRLDKALERGDVARSADLGAFFSLAAAGTTALTAVALSGASVRDGLAALLAGAGQGDTDRGGAALSGLKLAALAGGAPLLAGLVGGVLAGLMMHRPQITGAPLMPKLERISPLSGAKRLVARENLVQFVKTAAKIGVAGAVLVALWRADGRGLPASLLIADFAGLAGYAGRLTARLFFALLALFAVFAVLDAVWQHFAWKKRHRMTHQEVKEEHKEAEGSPEVKQRLKSLQRQRARQRMIAAVPKATVVIANPTHFAVALRYEKGMAAPVCLAKGVDELALKIRETAAEHRVPVVENPPLARALHATAKIDEEIPVEHYKAVAEVIGHVLRIARGRR